MKKMTARVLTIPNKSIVYQRSEKIQTISLELTSKKENKMQIMIVSANLCKVLYRQTKMLVKASDSPLTLNLRSRD